MHYEQSHSNIAVTAILRTMKPMLFSKVKSLDAATISTLNEHVALIYPEEEDHPLRDMLKKMVKYRNAVVANTLSKKGASKVGGGGGGGGGGSGAAAVRE